jgi:hypothetical protein
MVGKAGFGGRSNDVRADDAIYSVGSGDDSGVSLEGYDFTLSHDAERRLSCCHLDCDCEVRWRMKVSHK